MIQAGDPDWEQHSVTTEVLKVLQHWSIINPAQEDVSTHNTVLMSFRSAGTCSILCIRFKSNWKLQKKCFNLQRPEHRLIYSERLTLNESEFVLQISPEHLARIQLSISFPLETLIHTNLIFCSLPLSLSVCSEIRRLPSNRWYEAQYICLLIIIITP